MAEMAMHFIRNEDYVDSISTASSKKNIKNYKGYLFGSFEIFNKGESNMEILKKDYAFILSWAKRIKAIKILGGKCVKCGNGNIFVLDFHHDGDEKDFLITKIKAMRWSIIEKEIKRCVLLCRNCHAELHYTRDNVLKSKLLEIKKSNSCMECNYVGNGTASLDFHHVDEKNKSFRISRGYRDDRWKIQLEKIILEMDKCVVLCRNCHALKHVNIDRFNRFKNRILEREKKYIENKITNNDEIKKLYLMGFGTCKIAKIMGRSKSTISTIIHRDIL